MARADSLAGTPDPLALPERIAQLETRLSQLEGGIGGGFLLAPDADADGQLNVETNDGAKLQIFPPLVTPQMIADIWKQITPETVEFDLNRGTGQVTRVGSRVWFVGQATPINARDWHNGNNVIGVIPEEFRPTEWQTFPCSNEAAYDHAPRTTRMDVNIAGEIRFYSIPASMVDPHRVQVTIDAWTDQNQGHQHGTTSGGGGTSGNQNQNHTHVTDGKTSSGANVGHNHSTPNHTHSTPTAGVHSHHIEDYKTPHTYDQGATLVPNYAKYPNWVQCLGTWTIAQPEEGTEGDGGVI